MRHGAGLERRPGHGTGRRVVRSGGRRAEEGSAAVEFVLVMIILLPLFLGILQLGLFLHVRNTLVACAHEGARQAANYDASLGDGRAATFDCISGVLSAGMARDIDPVPDSAAGQDLVVMRVTATMPAMGLWGPTFDFTVEGHAVKEPTP
ncbi:TadE/TadG family type IV pilus assembly protein [Actinopolymorpha sp. B17G11]|uniref:TadE family protein n=1 Tax=unclassified Actinopolymorpha TaxID=2627063 RepID=UPI0032D92E8A